MQRYGKDFLKELLLPLINQWGREAVLHAIEELEDTPTKEDGSHQRVTRRPGTKVKTGAFTLAQRASVEPEKKALLLDLARQFEHRAFLPSIGDVRAFLEMRGQDSRGLKQRPEAFRRVIKAVVEMPKDSLQQLVLNNENAGGPSQLGPLSDAIKFASAAVRSSGEPALKNDQGLGAPSADSRNAAPIDRLEQEKDAAKSDQPVGSVESSSKRSSEENK
jgi:hypothetical protein